MTWMTVTLCRVKVKSSAGRAVFNQNLPFEGPAKTCHFGDAGPLTWVLSPARQPGFSACFGWETLKSFSLPAFQEWVLLQVPAWQPSVEESSLCLWAVNRRGCHGLSCQFWKDLCCRSFFSILDSVHFVCSCEHRLSANYDLGNAIQQHCISIIWVDMVLGFVTWYSYNTPSVAAFWNLSAR